MEQQENQAAQPWPSKGCKALWGKCPVWVFNFSAINLSLDSKWSPNFLPSQGQRGERADRHLKELTIGLDFSISPWSPVCHWDLLSTGSAAFPSSCHITGFSLLCLSNQKALSWFWALPSDAEQNFFLNLLIKSFWPASPLQKEDFKYHVQALAYLQCHVSSWEKSGASEESKQ